MVNEVPIGQKLNLTIEEAAKYSNIRVNRIRELSNDDKCPFVLWVGNKRLIKRRKFDEYVEKQFSI
ncbi:MAG: excisionase family DNA-binding protein [Lachnospiraceae bacterium]|nr:excisionase family DNA-binding protein [Lachnospiraceae bacterium]